ncbi:dnaJ homolog subfamily C member 24-like [Antedon mediterranea]|uniref:dnaJ homolog subfamily C member 24-like n=1 Tax=Antedon mediterranea TaxID=105859 RepID=UPI003AF815EE
MADAVESHADLYKIIGSDVSASKEELKKSYRKALLKCYPDKVEESEREAALNEYLKLEAAWKILGDDDTRRQYDAESNERHVQQSVAVNEEVEVEDMDFDDDVAYYPCRCGGSYILQELDIKNDVIVPCDICSLHIKLIVPDHWNAPEASTEDVAPI